jgi:hypothetical protein
MHRHEVSGQDIWKPDSIETMQFPSTISTSILLLERPQYL